MSINHPGPARFPLTPGRPLVFRCRNRGVWGYLCHCLHRSDSGATSSEQPNHDSWADALQGARDHVRYWHKSPARLETEALERLYAAPARAGRTA